MKRLLYIALLALLTASCAKDAAGRFDDGTEFPEANLIITGGVFDLKTEATLPAINVTLKSYLSSDKLQENPVSTETTSSGENGRYLLRKRFNEPANAMIHIVEFSDESMRYLPFRKEITISNWDLLLTPHGYEITHFDAYLNQAE